MPSVMLSAASIDPIAALSTALDEDVAPVPVCNAIDELNRIVGCSHGNYLNNQPEQILTLGLQPQLLVPTVLPNSLPAISDKLWEWSSLPEAAREFNTGDTSDFK